MEKAYAVLGVRDLASASEIEEAYRSKKRLYDLSRFVEDSQDWQFARARNEALDEAYRYAKNAKMRSPRGAVSGSWEDEYDDWYVSDSDQTGEIVSLAVVCPVAVYAMQFAAPTVFYETMPSGARGVAWLLDVMALFSGYLLPLITRFIFFRRPLKSLTAALLVFPFTLLSADFFTSLLLRFFILPESTAPHVPFFYLTGFAPLFILLHAHCAILGFTRGPKKSAPAFRRLTAYTFTLLASAAFSVALCAALNVENTPAPAAFPARHPYAEQAWQSLNLTDAGVIEIPGAWYIEDSNGKLTRTQHDGSAQYIREALRARTYGHSEPGLDFSFELLVYWWADASERVLPPPAGVAARIQDHQFDFIEREYPDIAFHARDVMELGGLAFSVLTVEANLISEFAVRFRNVVIERENKVYTFTLSYPAYEESAWSEMIEQVLTRWRL